MRLDRDVTEANTAWDELARGDVFECAPPIDAGRPRIARETHLCIRTPVIGPQR
jgi:hypothetical protein